MGEEQKAEKAEQKAEKAAPKKDSVYTVFTTEDDGKTLNAVGQVTAPTAERARRDGAKALLKDATEGTYVNVVVAAQKSLTVGRFGIERPEPRVVDASA